MPGRKRGPCSRLLQGDLAYSPTEWACQLLKFDVPLPATLQARHTLWCLLAIGALPGHCAGWGILDVNLGAEDRISESVPRDRRDLPVRAW